jgi:hypothetical protein
VLPVFPQVTVIEEVATSGFPLRVSVVVTFTDASLTPAT